MDLDWDENNELDLVCSIVWGPPHTGGPGQTAPAVLPPPVSGTATSCTNIFVALGYLINQWDCPNGHYTEQNL